MSEHVINKVLRIALVSPLWMRIPPVGYGGIESMMNLLIEELVIRGHHVTLFSSGDCETKAHLYSVCDINLTERIKRGEAYYYEYYANSAMAEVLRCAHDFDLIHYHIGPAWLPLAATVKTPGIFTYHTSPHIDDEFIIKNWPDVAINGISRYQMNNLSSRVGRRLHSIYNGCDFESFNPSFQSGQYLAYLGKMSFEKNPLDAIRYAHTVKMPLVMAGEAITNNDKDYFNDEILPLIDGHHIRWIGPVNHAQKNELLRHAAALLFMVQWDEPFGLVMVEAMACGTPVLAYKRGAVEEVVSIGETGYYAETFDELKEFFLPTLALNRQKVRQRASEKFCYHIMVDRYLDFYRKVISINRFELTQ